MCDFSQYGGPSEDWLAVEKTLPALSFDTSLGASALQKAVNEQRAQLAADAMRTLAPKVHIANHTIPTRDGSTIEARSYRPASKDAAETLPVYLYFHGGGFLFGSLDTEDATCSLIAINTGVAVFSANYRHTPDHVFPTAWHDAQDSFAWVHDNISSINGDASQIVVGGISAGGQLTASLVLEKQLGKALANYPPIAGQVLMIPCVAHLATYDQGPMKKMKSREVSSYVENEKAPLLPMSVVRFFYEQLKTGIPDLRDTKLNIVNATTEEVKGMPPTVFGIAGLDPLRDEGLLYAKLLAEAQVPTDVHLFKGIPHGARRFGDQLKANRKWDEVHQQGILWALSKPKATGKFEIKASE
ncbi:alpha/beta hydrolase fold-3 domain-containing protein [Sporormia fimetaria CBS 119925]|uniref:Alpha/beta hydrolase fold-3 domain-containing protein n=1 Tax=Sporormia fimetaria CBS 119925 TaxID=1340428 RepID=A0A6A6VMM0_9PLEO|nr:alpha/beta hydrolase fold-3 domain-containing protein [Sporormia fimetaria CBS 119925]